MNNMDVRKYIVEFFGTFALVFIGCGSAVLAGEYIGFVGISFAFGLTVLAMVFAIGHISGCHINPAVTFAMFVAGKIKIKDTFFYIASQSFGAVLASGVLFVIATGKKGYSIAVDGLGQNGYGAFSPDGYTLMACLAAEIVLTALFVFTIFGATHKNAPKGFAGIPIGFSLAFVHLVGIPITGTSVNPARSLGPAVFVGGTALSQLWLFWIAPIVGGIIVAIFWKYILKK